MINKSILNKLINNNKCNQLIMDFLNESNDEELIIKEEDDQYFNFTSTPELNQIINSFSLKEQELFSKELSKTIKETKKINPAEALFKTYIKFLLKKNINPFTKNELKHYTVNIQFFAEEVFTQQYNLIKELFELPVFDELYIQFNLTLNDFKEELTESELIYLPSTHLNYFEKVFNYFAAKSTKDMLGGDYSFNFLEEHLTEDKRVSYSNFVNLMGNYLELMVKPDINPKETEIITSVYSLLSTFS